MDASQYPALKTFLLTDPLTYGLAPLIAQGEAGYPAIVAQLMKVRDGTDGEAAQTIGRSSIASSELLEAIDIRDFNPTPAGVAAAAMPLAAGWLQEMVALPQIRLLTDAGVATRVKGNLDRLVGNSQQTQDRLNALALRFCSYAEKQGWGKVETWDVGRALAS